MAEEQDAAENKDGTGEKGMAAAIAMGEAAGATEEAREYLRRQSRLSDLQIENLSRKDAFELSHLRFRQFGDYARFAFEIGVGLVALLIVCGLGGMVWNAREDDALVVDAFSVPPDIAAAGMNGGTLAALVLDRYGQMQTQTISYAQVQGAYRSGNIEEVRVEIPETGISIGELDRYLREWLGHETHISGDLVHTKSGDVLTLRYGSDPGLSFTGPDLDALADKAAEQIYKVAQPLRYADYLTQHNRFEDAVAIYRAHAATGSAEARSLAYSEWSGALFDEHDYSGALDQSRAAVRLDPGNIIAFNVFAETELFLSHWQAAFDEDGKALSLAHGSAANALNPQLRLTSTIPYMGNRYHLQGDYRAALANLQIAAAAGSFWYDPGRSANQAAPDHDIGEARLFLALIPPQAADGRPNAEVEYYRAFIAWRTGDWKVALAAMKVAAMLEARPGSPPSAVLQSYLAYFTAESGAVAPAEALIAQTPMDCDDCMIARGRIAAVARDWAAAGHWFSILSARTPSLPMADTAWGEMLLQKGDLDGAIAKFKIANQKGPHFADPLEMWGEALMRKNRSDLALAKFEEAEKYAPNWGRLHLKWGEALGYAGRKDDAQKQFALAAGLDLSSADKAELAKVSRG